jgi:hypothetical protein
MYMKTCFSEYFFYISPYDDFSPLFMLLFFCFISEQSGFLEHSKFQMKLQKKVQRFH